jgi:integrase
MIEHLIPALTLNKPVRNKIRKLLKAYCSFLFGIECSMRLESPIREINTSEKYELVTTHTARRSLATNLILRGVSPYVVMKVTGHKSLSSFETYVRLQELEAMIQLKNLDFFNSETRINTGILRCGFK